MNTAKKLLSITLVLIMTLSLFAGCTPEQTDGPTAPVTNSPTAGTSDLDKLLAGVDAEYGFSIIEELSLIGNDGSELGFRNAGSTGEIKTCDRIIKELESLGVADIVTEDIDVDAWEFKSAQLTVEGDENGPITLASLAGTIGTPEGGITAELVNMGDGSYGNYKDTDVSGKIVLAGFDNNYYWFSAPIYEAELAGAAAMVVCVEGENYSNREETMLSFDCAARAEIPVVTISRENAQYLRGLMEQGPVTATLDSDISLTVGEGTSTVVSAVIPGRDTSRNITFGAHYDGYFKSFQDDLFGCGVLMGMIKSIIESGYQPEHNLIFNFIPAEEYGVSDSHYDWCTGVWKFLTEKRTDWAGKTICHFEIDSVRPDAEAFVINSTPEFHDYFSDYMEEVAPPADPYVNGKSLAGLNGPWSQDYSFALNGIPGLCAGKAASQWKTYAYHTQLDDATAWNPVVYEYIFQQYTTMYYDFDQMAVSPLDFTAVVDSMRDTLDTSLVSETAMDELTAAMDEVYAVYASAYTDAVTANDLFSKLNANADKISDSAALDELREELAASGEALLAAYKIIQGDLMRLDIWDMVTFPHEQLQLNMTSLNDTLAALEAGSAGDALGALVNVDTTYLAADFSKTVYEYVGIDSLDPTRDDLYWGTGQTMPQLNTYDLYHAIADKGANGETDFAAEIEILRGMITAEQELIDSAVTEEAQLLIKAAGLIKEADNADLFARCEELLAA